MKKVIQYAAAILLAASASSKVHAQSNEQITTFVKKDYAKERNAETMPSPRVLQVFLLDYNHDGAMDAIAYAEGRNPGSKVAFHSLGLYKNEHGKLRLVNEKSIGNRIGSVVATANGVSVTTLSFADSDPMCCPSVKTERSYTCLNDKIQ